MDRNARHVFHITRIRPVYGFVRRPIKGEVFSLFISCEQYPSSLVSNREVSGKCVTWSTKPNLVHHDKIKQSLDPSCGTGLLSVSQGALAF